MTEEENKAIEYLRLMRITNFKEYSVVLDKEKIDAILNLIEKLKKENEELHKEIERQGNAREIEEEYIEKKFISKDKIKGKIKEYNKEIKTYEDKMLEITQREKHQAIENKDYIKYSCIISNFTDKIKLLKELLEEE